MADINKDIERLSKILEGTLNEKWDTIFSKSTEDLNGVLSHIDVKDKSIYSVLSSSDILFYLYLNGAKSIDTFDINPLTYRYYFLRKWLLERGLMDAKNLKIDEISDIIENHSETNNIDEIESKHFWECYLDMRRKDSWFDERFFYFYTALLFEKPQTEFDFPYSNNDIKALSDKLNSLKLSFDNIDILSDKYSTLTKKYDIVYLSNILDLHSKYTMKNIISNLNELLRDNGFVICANMLNHPYFNLFEEQRRFFEEDFEYEELFTELRGIGKSPIKYYKYIKK